MTATFVCRLLPGEVIIIPGKRGPVVWVTYRLARLDELTASVKTLAVAWGRADRTGVVVAPMVMVWDR